MDAVRGAPGNRVLEENSEAYYGYDLSPLNESMMGLFKRRTNDGDLFARCHQIILIITK